VFRVIYLRRGYFVALGRLWGHYGIASQYAQTVGEAKEPIQFSLGQVYRPGDVATVPASLANAWIRDQWVTDDATKRAQATVTPGDDSGEFDMILSNGALDRDGEKLHLSDWAQPLPDTISINVNHSKDVSDIVGSGVPFFDSEGNLRVRGTFASNAAAQHIRSLVNERHLQSVSVEFLRTENGNVLVGGAFVNVPANPEARVLASKELDFERRLEDFDRRLDAVLSGKPDPGEMDHDGANKAAALRLRLKAIRS
jgi:hypothetical protein